MEEMRDSDDMEATRVPATYHLVSASKVQAGDVVKISRQIVQSVETSEGLTTITMRSGHVGQFHSTQRIGVLRRKEA